MRSFPFRDSRMPLSPRMSLMFAGLQPRRTISASWTPRRFSFWSILTGMGDVIMFLIFLAVAGRRTHAMNRLGIRGGGSAEGVVVPEGEGDAETCLLGEEMEVRIPERILVPSVPGGI